jgi:hypothetical protein
MPINQASPAQGPTFEPAVVAALEQTAEPQVEMVVNDQFDVVVVGAGLSGIAAVTAASGVDVLLVSLTNRFGGQAFNGVPTIDEGDLVQRESGIYRQFIQDLERLAEGTDLNKCYFLAEDGRDGYCPNPEMVHTVLNAWVENGQQAGRLWILEPSADTAVEVTDLLQTGRTVSGVVVNDQQAYSAPVTIDATEDQALYPLIEGLRYETGNGSCVQDATWVLPLWWYPNGIPAELVPPTDAPSVMAQRFGADVVNEWIAAFRTHLQADGHSAFPGWDRFNTEPLSFTVAAGYRGVAETRPEVVGHPAAPAVTQTYFNWIINDSPLPASAFADDRSLDLATNQALGRSYLLLWYLYHELGIRDWGLAEDVGYQETIRPFWDDLIPADIQWRMPPEPYIREGRRFAGPVLTGEDLQDRARFGESVMLGSYFGDFHGCNDGVPSFGGGLYEVPLDVFIPEGIDGFMTAQPRAGRVDRLAASSLRMQPTELIGGQVAGIVAALSVQQNSVLRDVDYNTVRQRLEGQGVIVDIP